MKHATLSRLLWGFVLGAALATCSKLAHAETFRPGGLLVNTDCDEYACSSYTFQVSKRFVRLPVKQQAHYVRDLCTCLDRGIAGGVRSCVFQYRGEDVMWLATTGLVEVDPGYLLALAALRD